MPSRDDERAELEAANQELHAQRAAIKAGEGGDDDQTQNSYLLNDAEALDREAERLKVQSQEHEQRERERREQRQRELVAASERNEAEMKVQNEADTSEAWRRVREARARAARHAGDVAPKATDRKRKSRKRQQRHKAAATAAESEPTIQTEHELMTALLNAESEGDVLAAVSRWCWAQKNSGTVCPPSRIASIDRLTADLKTIGKLDPEALRFTLTDSLSGYWIRVDLWVLDAQPLLKANLEQRQESSILLFGASVNFVHGRWLEARQSDPDLPHPFESLVTTWQRNRPIEREHRRHGILPDSWRDASYYDHLPLQPEPNSAPPGMVAGNQHLLPLAELQPQPSVIVPVLPLALYDSGTGPMATRGRGAPYAQRLFVEILLDVGRLDRVIGQTARVNAPLRDLVAWLWPRGWKRSRKGNRPGDLQILQRALLELDGMRILWDRVLWRLVAVQALPTEETLLDDTVVFRVEHLPGSEHGPMVDRNRLRKFGTVSAPAWRAYLRLAYLWDAAKAKNNGSRVYATRPVVARVAGPSSPIVGSNGKVLRDRRGVVVTDWSDRRAQVLGANGKPASKDNPPAYERNPAADRVSVLGPEDLVRLSFDDAEVSRGTFRKRLYDARQALATMAAADAVVLEPDSHGGLRVLEPRGTRGNAEGDTR